MQNLNETSSGLTRFACTSNCEKSSCVTQYEWVYLANQIGRSSHDKIIRKSIKDLRNLRHAVCDLLLCFKEKNDEDGLSKKQCIQKN